MSVEAMERTWSLPNPEPQQSLESLEVTLSRLGSVSIAQEEPPRFERSSSAQLPRPFHQPSKSFTAGQRFPDFSLEGFSADSASGSENAASNVYIAKSPFETVSTPSPFDNGKLVASQPVGWGGSSLPLSRAGSEPAVSSTGNVHGYGIGNGLGNGRGPYGAGGPSGYGGLPPQHVRGGGGGRGRGRDAGRRARGYRRLWQQVTRLEHGQTLSKAAASLPFADLSVEDLVAIVQGLAPDASAVPAVSQGLYYHDSRAVAALLKEIAKMGHTHHAMELFDWLRSQPPHHELSALCDVFTYTTVISLCGAAQQLRKALELVAEMRSRGITCNVHTYSALMNVCIKCGELELALDVYNQLQVEGCQPNVVTYNTLVDVYGKLGRWEAAVKVLDQIRMNGLEPEIRTYNTAIIACNMCNQPGEALRVYDGMVAAGYQPTATTYTALISAYGKAGQLDKALEIFQQMVTKGCERNVITYSALISACEKAGQWRLALELFDQMQKEGCHPNVVTYNSLLTACAQGAQWEEAANVFEHMRLRRCKPDVVTYTALISAYEHGGQWRLALKAFESMQQANCRPDAIVYSAIVDVLWGTGCLPAQAKALHFHQLACRNGLLGMMLNQGLSPDGNVLEVAITALVPSVAVLAVHKWLAELRERCSKEGMDVLRRGVALSLGRPGGGGGGHKPHHHGGRGDGGGGGGGGSGAVRAAVSAMLEGFKSPFTWVSDAQPPRLHADSWQLGEWLMGEAFDTNVRGMVDFPLQAGDAGRGRDGREDGAMEAACSDAFKSVVAGEERHHAAVEGLPYHYLAERSDCIALVKGIAERLGWKPETLHDAVLLMDRCQANAALLVPEGANPVLAVACAVFIARGPGAEAPEAVPSAGALESAVALPPGSLAPLLERLHATLQGDFGAVTPVSALRCLELYLERLGVDGARSGAFAGGAFQTINAALSNVHFVRFRPTVLAAAALYSDRRARGWWPLWPTALASLTGWRHLEAYHELAAAIAAVEKLKAVGDASPESVLAGAASGPLQLPRRGSLALQA